MEHLLVLFFILLCLQSSNNHVTGVYIVVCVCACVFVCGCVHVYVYVCVCVCVSMMWGRKRKMITHGLDLSPCSSTLEIVDLMFWATFAVLSQLWKKLRRKAWEDFTLIPCTMTSHPPDSTQHHWMFLVCVIASVGVQESRRCKIKMTYHPAGHTELPKLPVTSQWHGIISRLSFQDVSTAVRYM